MEELLKMLTDDEIGADALLATLEANKFVNDYSDAIKYLINCSTTASFTAIICMLIDVFADMNDLDKADIANTIAELLN